MNRFGAVVVLLVFAAMFSVFSTTSFAAITFTAGNYSGAPVNNLRLNFSWTNTTPITANGGASGYYNATANITFNLPAGINYTSGSAWTNVTGNLTNTVQSNTSFVIFGNTTTNDTTTLAGNFSFNISAAAGGNYTITVNEVYLENGTLRFIFNTSVGVQINQTTPTLTVNSNVSSPITYPTASSLNGTGCPAELTCTLYRGNSTVSITSGNDSVVLGVGVYSYNYSTAGDNNYTSASASSNYTLNVSQGSLALMEYLQNVSANATVTYPTAITEARGNISLGIGICTDCTYHIYINSSGIFTASGTNTSAAVITSPLLAVGNFYNLIYNSTGGTNYSSVQNTSLWFNQTIGTPTLSLLISPSNSTAYPTTTTANGTLSSMNVAAYNVSLYRNSSLVNSSITAETTFETILLGSAVYNYTVVFNGSQNYTSVSLQNITNITKGTLSLNISNATAINVTYPSTTTVNATEFQSSGDSDVNYTFWRNATLIGSGKSTSGNNTQDSQYLAVSNNLYILNTTAGPFANWTVNVSGVSLYVNISQGTPTVTTFLGGLATNRSEPYPLSVIQTLGNASYGNASVIPEPSFNLFGNSSSAVTFSLASGNPASAYPALSADTYQIIYNTSGNANWTSATNNTLFLTVTSTSSSSSSGGGGAPTNSGTLTTVSPGIVGITISSAAGGSTTDINISNSDTGLTELDLGMKNTVSLVGISVNSVSNLPSGTSAPPGTVFQILNFVENNFANADLDHAVIHFKVSKSWLSSNNLSPTQVTLFRFSNKAWNALTTTQSSEDSNYVYFSATSPGLSYFAVAGQSQPVQTTTSSTQTSTIPPSPQPSATSTTSSYVPSTNLNGNQLIAVGVIAIAVLVFLLYRFAFSKKK